MKFAQRAEKATEILTVMKMWDISLRDARMIVSCMNAILSQTRDAEWKNPLAGTGMKAEQ